VCAFFVFLLLTAFIMGDQALMDEVTVEIKAVCVKLEEVEAEIKIKQARAEHNEVAALRKKEEQLRTEKEQLRTKELLLLQRQPGALSSCVPRVHAWLRTHMHVCQRHG
jgi:hypothetical protein